MERLAFETEHVLSYSGEIVTPPEVIGPLAEGIRANFYSAGGAVVGSKVRGKLRPVGGDWATVRSDDLVVLDVRATIETDDGALILMTYGGLIDLGDGGYGKFLRGELPAVARIRTTPRFATSHPSYLWMNRLCCFGIGEFRTSTNAARYDVYALR